MKREEEIQKLIDEETGIDNYGSFDYQIGVCDGVRFADKTMLDRACEWLENELKETDDKNGYPTVEGRYFVSVKEFINEFRQAMKGGAE